MSPQHVDAELAAGAARVIADLRELAALTSDEHGAQRVAWTPMFLKARAWFAEKVRRELGARVELDAAGNQLVSIPGEREDAVLVAGHLDSVPNGGWLDGCLGTLTALEALRRYARQARKPVTLCLVDWADEEGARFGRSLLGSSAAAGTLKIEEIRNLRDRDSTALSDALHACGVDIDRMLDAHPQLLARRPRAYIEVHIEQGPVLESMGKPTGVVLGAFGVERHMLTFTGQAAHAGSTPVPMRRDAFLAAAQFALAAREIALQHSRPGANAVCTCGNVDVSPGIVTAIPGKCRISLDQRALDAGVLARMLAEARAAAEEAARVNNVDVAWETLLRIPPRPFDPRLIALAEEAVRETTGDAPRLPSGPLHDSAEMAPLMPTVMLFAQSTRGLSHCKEEDTPLDALEKTIIATLRLVDKTIRAVAGNAL